MTEDKRMIDNITETADMGRDSLNHIIEKATDPQLKSALEKQFDQYDQTYKEAQRMLEVNGDSPKKIGAPVKMYSHIVSDMKTMGADNVNSKIAEMVIQGNTMGITEMTKQLRNYRGENQELRNLVQRHIEAEQNSIEEMKKYL